MSLHPSRLVGALALAQATGVAPALAGSYAGSSAATIAAVLILVAQDLARPPPDPAEWAAIDARLADLADEPDNAGETRRLIGRLVEITEAALLHMPPEA